jgi:hypothetical protein
MVILGSALILTTFFYLWHPDENALQHPVYLWYTAINDWLHADFTQDCDDRFDLQSHE